MTRAAAPSRPAMARAIEVRGVVQGVGFRPFIWRLADRFELTGWVRNDGGVVRILAEGGNGALDAFVSAIREEAPPLARIDEVSFTDAIPTGAHSFEVDESRDVAEGSRLVSPDVATCPACLEELFDPSDRRYRYAFVNCTDCGPRFTIIESLPYDRERTSMRVFPMCADCEREYRDPSNRRFHAEPIACPACGPTIELRDARGRRVSGDPIEKAAALLEKGKIVAVKGLGGFHLACDATNEKAVATLRSRKARPDKPFAVMVADLEAARERFKLATDEEATLASPRAPIVLVPDRGTLAPSIAPGFRVQGAMLPSTPLHHLLLRAVGRPLVMTSGNRSDEPICIDNDEALERLAGIADAFLLHDREIVARYDDTVWRVWRGGPVSMRRARSCAPAPVLLPCPVEPILGCGAELHGTFALAEAERAFVSQHIGDLDTEEAMAAYSAALDRFRELFRIDPEIVAHDLHPDFMTTRFAQATGLPAIAVQHHHAHIAAVMAENRLDGSVIGVAFDGFGLGEDGTAWGGELLVVEPAIARRVGHLRPVQLPGGDAAVRHPWRMALAYAEDAGVWDEALELLGTKHEDAEVVLGQIRSGLASPITTSAGRLFDAVSALTGVCRLATFEGQPAILLEQAASGGATREYPFDLGLDNGAFELDVRPIVRSVVHDLLHGRKRAEVAGRFHRTMAAAILEMVRTVRGMTGLNRVCLGGGVFQNDMLMSDVTARLETVGLQVFVPRQIPVGDGGISLGQVLVAHARTEG